jgi:hypothetical protein
MAAPDACSARERTSRGGQRQMRIEIITLVAVRRKLNPRTCSDRHEHLTKTVSCRPKSTLHPERLINGGEWRPLRNRRLTGHKHRPLDRIPPDLPVRAVTALFTLVNAPDANTTCHLFLPLRLLTRSSIHCRMRSAICRLFLSCMIMWLLPRMPRSGGLSICA